MREVAMQPEGLRLMPLESVEPLLPSCADVVYEYTIPLLREHTLDLLGESASAVPRVYKAANANRRLQSLEERYLPGYEAAKLVASVYSRCIEPLRFSRNERSIITREEIFEGFARALLTTRVLPAVELVAENIYTLRELDSYQPEIGANTVRWMEYLAFEALESDLLQVEGGPDSDIERLRSALREIRDATSVLDRYRALMRTPEPQDLLPHRVSPQSPDASLPPRPSRSTLERIGITLRRPVRGATS
jgi:hypothetical protein